MNKSLQKDFSKFFVNYEPSSLNLIFGSSKTFQQAGYLVKGNYGGGKYGDKWCEVIKFQYKIFLLKYYYQT